VIELELESIQDKWNTMSDSTAPRFELQIFYSRSNGKVCVTM